MSADLNTSLKPEPFVPNEQAVLPIAADLASEYASWVGQKVYVKTPGYHGADTINGDLLGLLKGANGEIVLKIRATNEWSTVRDGERVLIPSIHLIPQSKINSASRAE